MGHSLGAHIGVRLASHHPDRVAKLALFDGGLDVRAEVFDSIAPSINRLGVEFLSVEMFLAIIKTLPMFEGRWNDHLARHFAYDVEPGPGGGVRSRSRSTPSRKRLGTSSARGSGPGTTGSRRRRSCCARRTGSSPQTTAS